MDYPHWNILQITDTDERLYACTPTTVTEVPLRPARRKGPAPRPLRSDEADFLPQGAQHHPDGETPRATKTVNDLATIGGTTERYFQRLGQAVRERTAADVPLFVAIDSGRVAFFGMNSGLDATAFIDSRGADPKALWRQSRTLLDEQAGRLTDTTPVTN